MLSTGFGGNAVCRIKFCFAAAEYNVSVTAIPPDATISPTPEVRITRAVKVQMTIVSKNTSTIP